MFWSLLADAATGSGEPAATGSSLPMYIVLGVVVVIFVVWMVFSGRKNKQRQKEYTEQLEAIRPGHKVKTAGGICGIVVEVCDDNTVIMETGSETAGKSYIKMDKELIAQTDAKGPTQIAREEAEARRKAEEAEKKAKKSGEVPAPVPAREDAEEKSEPAEAKSGSAEEKEEK